MNGIINFCRKKLFKNQKQTSAIVICSVILLATVVLFIYGVNAPETEESEQLETETTLCLTEEEEKIELEFDTKLVPSENIDIEIIEFETDEETISDETEEITEPEETEEPEEKEPEITIHYLDVDVEVPYETIYKYDTTMRKGEVRIEEGENGLNTNVYELTFTDGVETSRRLDTVKVIKEPVAKIVYEGTIDTQTSSRGDTFGYTEVLECTATAYADNEPNNIWGNHIAFSYLCGGGLTTRWGIIAVDPSVIPAGTKVYIETIRDGIKDYGYAIAADTGGSITGNKIDLWMDDYELCNTWGVKKVNVYILDDQSVDIFELRGDYEWSPS